MKLDIIHYAKWKTLVLTLIIINPSTMREHVTRHTVVKSRKGQQSHFLQHNYNYFFYHLRHLYNMSRDTSTSD